MQRHLWSALDAWATDPARRPLVLRGARQVGKTWLLETFGGDRLGAVATLNLERHALASSLFTGPTPAATVRAIEAVLGVRIEPGKCLLGRISHLHLEPLSFLEFVASIAEESGARAEAPLASFLRSWQLGEPVPEAVHEKLLRLCREYAVVGGMPAVVAAYHRTGSWTEVARVQHDLLATLRDDFAKYATRASAPRLRRVLDAVPRLIGRKLKLSEIDREERSAVLSQAFDLLCQARVCHRVRATHARGVPLGAEVDERRCKALLLDTGLLLPMLHLGPLAVAQAPDLTLVNEGAIAEHLVGQMLRTLEPPYVEPALFYWQREARGAEAEVDYVVQHEGRVVPIEVKAGKPGSLRSLHRFVHERRVDLAVRISSQPPGLADVKTAVAGETPRAFRLLSLPFYLVSELPRLLVAAS